MTDQHFLCTRPQLAQRLANAGIPLTRTSNPFAEDQRHGTAWDVILDQTAVRIIYGFYMTAGRPLPKAVKAFMNRGDRC